MNVLSLFDGMSVGQLTLKELNIEVNNYFASEIDKYAIGVTKYNFPNTIHIGDVRNVDVSKLSKIDLLIGGSPCQSFSFSGKRNGMTSSTKEEITSLERYLELKEKKFEFDGYSYLFWEYMRILKDIQKYNPNVKFLLENVKMSKKWKSVLDEAIGVEGVLINSNLVSAQNRPRLYWCNWKIEQPKDKNIKLKDILENIPLKENPPSCFFGNYCGVNRIEKGEYNWLNQEKAKCLTTGSGHGNKFIIDKSIKPSVAKNIVEQHTDIEKSDKDFFTMNCESGFQDNKIGLIKTPTLRAGNNSTYIKQDIIYRKITPIEAERLQTLPDNYTKFGIFEGKIKEISKTQRYKMIGNGWTLEVIKHIIKQGNIK